jgi:WD40 repeat protein
MAPEQAAGKGKDIGPHTDVYALGAILYETMTGRAPFQADTPLETLQQVVGEEPALPSRLKPKLPRDLETICLKCLLKEPARRYASAAALADDLQRFLSGEPIRARPVGRTEKVWRWCRRNPTLAGAVAAASVFLVSGTVVSSLLAFQARREAGRADEEAASARAAKLFSDRRFYASEMKLASLDWEARHVGFVMQRLREQEPHGADAADLRGIEWYYLRRHCELEYRTLKGHADRVTGVAFSPDGQWLASASRDGTLRVWNTADGKGILTLQEHTGPVWGLAFSQDGTYLASAGGDGTVKVWDAASGRLIRTLQEHAGAVLSVAFSPEGRLASGGQDGTVRVWDPQTGQELRQLEAHTGYVFGVAFGPNGRIAAAGGGDGAVRVWDAASGQELAALRGQTYGNLAVAFSPDGKQLASGGADETVMIWDVAGWQRRHTLQGQMVRIFGLSFSADGRRLAAAGQTGKIRVWDPSTGEEIVALRARGRCSGVAFSPDGRRLAGAFEDGSVLVWDAATRDKTLTFEGHAIWVLSAAFSPDGKQLASAGQDPTVKVWNAATGDEVSSLSGHTDLVICVVYSPDGRRLASASEDGTVRIWDIVAGKPIHTLAGHTGPVWGVAFSPDGRQLASAGRDGSVRLWNSESGQQLLSLEGHTGGVWGVTFSPDGRCLAFASGDAKHQHPGHSGYSPIAPANGSQTVKVWDLAAGRETLSLAGHKGSVFGVAFSPDGRRLASTGTDGTVRVWDAGTGRSIHVLEPRGWIEDARFSPEGRRIASCSTDGTVKLWDADTGQELLTLKGHSRSVFRVAFSPDGRRLASASSDGTVKVWDATDLTPQGRIEYEARGLVEWLLAKPLPPEEAANAVRQDATITEPVRKAALAWVQPCWRIKVRAEATHVVGPLFAKGLPRGDVQADIRANSTLSESLRQEALSLAERLPQSAQTLVNASMAVTAYLGAEPAKYQLALRQAEVAYELAPQDAVCVHALGVAQYHVGKYQEAVEKLAQADKLFGQRIPRYYPCNLKFLAMAQHQLGRKDEARGALERLRECMKQVEPARQSAVQRFLREAEELINPKQGGQGP